MKISPPLRANSPVPPPSRESTKHVGAPHPMEPGRSAFAQMVSSLASRIDRGERDLSRATTMQGSADPQRLLALQAGMYRYVEAVDLATKLIDRGVSAVKTTLQGQ